MKTARITTATMVRLAVLLAILLIMAYTPLGYLKIGIIEISFMMIPVAIASVVLGPGCGAFMGAVFGLTSFIQCFGASQFGAMLLSINPIFTFIVCMIPRILAGWLPGLIFKAISGKGRAITAGTIISCLCAALLNTIFFVGALILLFGSTDYIQGFGNGVWAIIWAIVGINGIIEAPVCAIIGGAISRALLHFKLKKQ